MLVLVLRMPRVLVAQVRVPQVLLLPQELLVLRVLLVLRKLLVLLA